MTDDLDGLLEATSIFAELTADGRALVARHLRERAVAAGEVLITKGGAERSLFIVASGRLRAIDDGRVIAELGPGEPVGEMALVTDDVRSATVIAVRDSLVYELSGDDFETVFAIEPSVLRGITTVIVRRLRDRLEERAHRAASGVVCVLAVDPSVDVTGFVARLRAALESAGDEVATFSPSSDASDEAPHDVDLLVGDPTAPDWTGRALRRADVVLLLTGPATVGRGRDVEQTFGLDERWDGAELRLVIERPTLQPIRDAARVLRQRSVAGHHHVTPADPESYSRLARILRGRAVAVVLGGGGARGTAHIGVVAGLVDAGVAIDAIGGSSAGGVVAGPVALGWDPDRLLDGFSELLARRLVDPTVPLLAFASGARLGAALEEFTDGYEIEDLPIQYACQSADLAGDEGFLHRSGPLWLAMRATMSMPGVFPPVRLGDRLLVDGGLADNVPVAPIRSIWPGYTVIAVDVGRDSRVPAALVPEGGVARITNLLRMFRRTRGNRLTVLDVISSSSALGTTFLTADPGDLVVRPDVAHIGMFQFDRVDEGYDIGRRAADAALEEWRRDGRLEAVVGS